jgi:hypothetical protein
VHTGTIDEDVNVAIELHLLELDKPEFEKTVFVFREYLNPTRLSTNKRHTKATHSESKNT